jgi:hypothetical protein
MTINRSDEFVRQPSLEVIDDLCFTIQRQSATCMELVRQAVYIEREQCAKAAEQIGEALAASDETARLAAERIADKIRSRAGREIALTASAAM